ncbi:uncharacterized protein LOC116300503 [Actinia tenebrosa]|uniref:Uncharacterized protein LOC116300503 n=1 Tax=Actinia tenebrosa TaxID=6105 RepID=A0A6P8ICF0_ACTTE|nr:uncharacterized protein LOC116300503 [Actinia tenebrosa]
MHIPCPPLPKIPAPPIHALLHHRPNPILPAPPIYPPWEHHRPQQSILDTPIHPERLVAEAVMNGAAAPNGQCVDISARCPYFALQGMCDSPSLFYHIDKVRHLCQLSCGLCNGNGAGPGFWLRKRKSKISEDGEQLQNLLDAVFSKKTENIR